MNLITYQKVIVEPYEFKHIQHLKITKAPNEHSKLYLTGILPDEINESYINSQLEPTTIKVKAWLPVQDPDTGKTVQQLKPIFSGIVQDMKLMVQSGIHYLEIEAISHSKKLDIEWIRRSYQKLGMPYKTLMQKAVEKYTGATVMYKIKEDKKMEQFTLQYDETAWEFLKRMASRLKAPLVVEDVLDEPKIYAGIPEKSEVGSLNDFMYHSAKKIDWYRDTTKNYKNDLFEGSSMHHEIVTEKVFEIGDKVSFKDIPLYVHEVCIEMSEGIFRNIYKLTDLGGFHQNIIKNEKIIGLSLEGKVLATSTDELKLFLDIDKPHPPDDYCWFKYSTFYTSDNGGGHYWMPELGEKARLYLPDWDDENAVSTNCVREEFAVGGERGNPDIKYWRSLKGKEFMFLPDGIKIRCKDGEIFINMMVENGILIQSSKGIYFIANEGAEIGMYAEGKMVMAAEEEFDAFCNGSRINMKDGITKIRGDSVQDN